MKFKADTMNALLKIITDIDCNLYVDGVLNTMVSSNEMTFISLERGEYWVQLISVNDPYYKIEQVISMESNKVIVADFCSLIKDEDIVFVQREGCYRNLKSNTNITSNKYDRGNKFIDGLAKVYRNGMWGQINKVGEEVTACKYLDEDFTIKCILPCNFVGRTFFAPPMCDLFQVGRRWPNGLILWIFAIHTYLFNFEQINRNMGDES